MHWKQKTLKILEDWKFLKIKIQSIRTPHLFCSVHVIEQRDYEFTCVPECIEVFVFVFVYVCVKVKPKNCQKWMVKTVKDNAVSIVK